MLPCTVPQIAAMDENPYASPVVPRGFHEQLDQPAIARALLDASLLKREMRKIVELTGVGGYFGVLIFAGLVGVGLLWRDPLGLVSREPIMVLVAIAAAMATHVGSIWFFARRRLRKMHAAYDIQPGDSFEIEVCPGLVKLRSDRIAREWELCDVAAIGGSPALTFVIGGLLTLPVPSSADFGELDLRAFTAIYKEQQRRYRETRPLFERLRHALRAGDWF